MTDPGIGRRDHRDLPPGSPGPTVSTSSPAPLPEQETGAGGSADSPGSDLAVLVRRSGNGDEAAFAALYDATASKVYGLAVRVTRSPEIAAEVVQEVYLMAWQQSARFDPDRGTVVAWLCTLAHRRAVDRVRQVDRERSREQTYEDRRAQTPVDQTWQEVEQTMDTHEVRAGLGALSALQREAVALAYYQGCTYQEVAQRLEIPLGTAKARIRDGLRNLRSALGAQS